MIRRVIKRRSTATEVNTSNYVAILLVQVAYAAAAAAIQLPQPHNSNKYNIQIQTQIRGAPVNRIPLRRTNGNMDDGEYTKPYCFVASSSSSLGSSKYRETNFLATQVWPSARVVSMALESLFQSTNSIHSICEFGCGPGLPSITAATLLLQNRQQRQPNEELRQKDEDVDKFRVYATDIDPLALEFVKVASYEQNLHTILQTKQLDVTANNNILQATTMPDCDLYIFSDVFETTAIAQGCATIVYNLLCNASERTNYIWVFCQNDRSQRDTFVNELRNLVSQHDDDNNKLLSMKIDWESPNQQFSVPIDDTTMMMKQLWLCEIDEMKVPYN